MNLKVRDILFHKLHEKIIFIYNKIRNIIIY